MLVAQQKRNENIAEYVLYMFQIEDIIRAYNLDIQKIDDEIVSQYDEDYDTKRDIREWYQAIINMLKDNRIEKSGHIPLVQSMMDELENLHLTLIKNKSKETYREAFAKAKPSIEELKMKSGKEGISDIEVCFNGLYGLLLLKMQKKKITPETEKAFEHISEFIARLSSEFHKYEKGQSDEN